MSEILLESEDSEGVQEEDIPNFEDMDTDEFFDCLVADVAEKLGVSVDELDEMAIGEIEEGLEVEVKEPYHPRGTREGYRDNDRLKTISKEDHENRRKKVERWLDL